MGIKASSKRKRQKKVKTEVIEISSSSPEKETDGTPVRSMFCLKRKIDMERIDLSEDCFFLDFNPFDSFHTSKISAKSDSGDAPDLSVIAEKGQVACRDYPHSRHLCLSFPFETTPHEKCCELCYCYVCDSAAPCKYWTPPNGTHCHALDIEGWRDQRKLMKKKPVAHK